MQLPALQHTEQLAGLSLQEQQHHLDRTDTECYGAINHHDRAIQHKANVWINKMLTSQKRPH